jgi:hypothetical protein
MPRLSSTQVDQLFRSCLWDDEQIAGLAYEEIQARSFVAEGVVHTVGFDPAKIQRARPRIDDMLDELDPKFAQGWSFLNLCWDRHGEQWTGFHLVVEQLVQMGMAIGRVRYCLPRDMWSALPGAMPYVIVSPKATAEAPPIKL